MGVGAIVLAGALAASAGLIHAQGAASQPPPNQGMELSAEDRAIRDAFQRKVDEVLSDPLADRKIMDAGRRRTILCASCHGKDGNAIRPGVPNLAGQNPIYLLDQFQRFADGRRYDFAMSTLSETFSEREKVMLALFYSRLMVKPADIGHPGNPVAGKVVYEQMCGVCHGARGRGETGFARLAGQRPDYVVKMLNEFREHTGRRSNPWMTGVALRMSRQQMNDVAAYIARMP